MLILSMQDVKKTVSMQQAIDTVEKAFADYYLGKTISPLRSRIDCHKVNGSVLFMPAYMDELGGLGVKIVSVFPQNLQINKPTISAIMLLNSVETGEPVALMDATYLTALRTGAASGVATKHLANKEVKKMAVFGAGAQALRQLEAILEVREVDSIYVYDLSMERSEQFIALCKQELSRFSFDMRAALNSEEAVLDADVIVTATTSNVPVFNGKDIKSGVHINAVGSYTPDMQELDETTITRAHKIVIDSYEASFKEAGDLIIPLNKGLITEKDIYGELGKIASGHCPGRENRNEITYFKSVGIAVQDIAVAKLIYNNALQKGFGRHVEL